MVTLGTIEAMERYGPQEVCSSLFPTAVSLLSSVPLTATAVSTTTSVSMFLHLCIQYPAGDVQSIKKTFGKCTLYEGSTFKILKSLLQKTEFS